MNEIGLRQVIFAVGLITGFIFFISIAVFYSYSLLQTGDYCTCTETIPLLIIVVASLGLFVGSFAYYYLVDRFIGKYKKKTGFKKALAPFLGLLDAKERMVIEKLLESNSIGQSEIAMVSGLDRVQVTRVLQRLEEKNFIRRTKKGKSNLVELNEEIIGLLK